MEVPQILCCTYCGERLAEHNRGIHGQLDRLSDFMTVCAQGMGCFYWACQEDYLSTSRPLLGICRTSTERFGTAGTGLSSPPLLHAGIKSYKMSEFYQRNICGDPV